MLHLILQRVSASRCTGFCTASEVFFGDLKIVFGGDLRRIADPRTHDMERIRLGQLCLAAGAEVLEQPRPGLHARSSKDADELSPQVRVRVAVASDDVDGAWLRPLEGLGEVLPEFREQGDPAVAPVLEVFLLWAPDEQPVSLPIDVRPLQAQVLRRTPEAAETTQGE